MERDKRERGIEMGGGEMCIKLQRVKKTVIQSGREKCVFSKIFFSNNPDLFQATYPIILMYSKNEHIEGSSEKVAKILWS
jgi:hypothetical protein